MLTQTRKNGRMEGTMYRDYSRKRYNQLKQQYPDLRESEIVNKIMREWDAFSMKERKNMKLEDLIIENLPVQTSITPIKVDHKGLPIKFNIEPTSAKLENQEANSVAVVPKKLFGTPERSNKKIQKQVKKITKVEDYMTFYKFYYDVLMKQHPNWTANQATIIIKLLWRKRKNDSSKKTTRIFSKKFRSMSGRQLYGKIKAKDGLSAVEIRNMWKHLPLQSRNSWEMQGRCSQTPVNPKNKVSVMKLKVADRSMTAQKEFSFLDRV